MPRIQKIHILKPGTTGAQGEPGATPVLYGVSATSMAIGTGSKTFTVPAGLALQAPDWVMIANSGTNWMIGQITAYAGTSMTVNVTRINGSGTFAAWAVDLAGAPGMQGTQGIQGNPGNAGTNGTNGTNGTSPVIAGTSASSVAIGTGSKSFTTQTGLSWSVGQWIIAASTASPANFMLGQITAYNAGTGALTLNVTTVGGSGTFTAWTLGLSSVPGGVTGVADSSSIDLTLTGGLLSGAAIFGTTTGTILQGDHATAINQHGDLVLAVAADQATPANGTALQDLPNLTFAVGANEKWYFEALLVMYVNTGTLGITLRPVLSQTPSQFKVYFHGTTTGAGVLELAKITTNNTDAAKAFGAFSHGSDNSIVRITGTFTNGATPGTFKLQYANKNSTGSSQAYVEAGAVMLAKRMV